AATAALLGFYAFLQPAMLQGEPPVVRYSHSGAGLLWVCGVAALLVSGAAWLWIQLRQAFAADALASAQGWIGAVATLVPGRPPSESPRHSNKLRTCCPSRSPRKGVARMAWTRARPRTAAASAADNAASNGGSSSKPASACSRAS